MPRLWQEKWKNLFGKGLEMTAIGSPFLQSESFKNEMFSGSHGGLKLTKIDML